MVLNIGALSIVFPGFTDTVISGQEPRMRDVFILTTPVPIAGLYGFYKILQKLKSGKRARNLTGIFLLR
jgi:hypothetical protein